MSSTQNETTAGSVSAQAASGEVVTISIARPDGNTDVVSASTDANGNYTTTYTATMDGVFSATASVSADATYSAATSSPVQFTVSTVLLPRTVSLSVTPA